MPLGRIAFPLGALLALSGCFDTASKPDPAPLPALSKAAPLSTADAAFIQALNEADLADTALADLAAGHAAAYDVKTLSETVSRDAADSQAALGKLVSPHDVVLTTTPMSGDREEIERFGLLHGARFDRAYLARLRRGNPVLASAIDTEIAQSKNADLLALARNARSTLMAHQSSAGRLAEGPVRARRRR